LRKDVEVIERVQRGAIILIEKCRGFEYEGRLKETKLATLEARGPIDLIFLESILAREIIDFSL